MKNRLSKNIFRSLFVFLGLACGQVSAEIGNPNLQYFGFWGGNYWTEAGSELGSSLYYDFIGPKVHGNTDTHLVAVAGNKAGKMYDSDCGNDDNLSASFCRTINKLDYIVSVSGGRTKYKALLSIEGLLVRISGSGHKILKEAVSLRKEANRILAMHGLPEVPPPGIGSSNMIAKNNMAAIKAVIKALDAVVFPNTTEGKRRRNIVEIISIVDEPYLRMGINTSAIQNSKSWQRWVNWELNKSSLADKKTYVNFTKHLVWLDQRLNNGTKLKDLIAWDYDIVSFDCYSKCTFNSIFSPADESIVKTTKKLMRDNWPHQKVFMIPYAGIQDDTSCYDNNSSADPARGGNSALVNAYFRFAAASSNNEIIGLLPFRWHDNIRTDPFCGAYRYDDLIQTLGDIAVEIGNN